MVNNGRGLCAFAEQGVGAGGTNKTPCSAQEAGRLWLWRTELLRLGDRSFGQLIGGFSDALELRLALKVE